MANAQTKSVVIQGGKFLGSQIEPTRVYRNVPVPPSGYIHGTMALAFVRVYVVESEGVVYEVMPHRGWFTTHDPLHADLPGGVVTLRLDTKQDRLYVILPDRKHGLAREFRYDVVKASEAR